MSTVRTTFGGTPVDLRKREAGKASPPGPGGGTPVGGTEAVTPVRHTPTEITHRTPGVAVQRHRAALDHRYRTQRLPTLRAPSSAKSWAVILIAHSPFRDLGE